MPEDVIFYNDGDYSLCLYAVLFRFPPPRDGSQVAAWLNRYPGTIKGIDKFAVEVGREGDGEFLVFHLPNRGEPTPPARSRAFLPFPPEQVDAASRMKVLVQGRPNTLGGYDYHISPVNGTTDTDHWGKLL